MDTVTSRDGTPIAFHRAGAGEPVIFVTGVFNDHTTCAPVAGLLESDHTVITYDRRARGESGDTGPYAIEREVEDLAALVEQAGTAAAVFGFSSGAMLALKAAADGVKITHLALYEPPFAFGDVGASRTADLPRRLAEMVEQGRPGEAVELFQRDHLGLPAEMVEQIRRSPMWPALEAMAQSMVYDALLSTALAVPTAAMTAVGAPTLVISGAETWPHLRESAAALAEAMPAARHAQVSGGHDHQIPPEPTASMLREFLRRH
jgi:pimeloyl-ACP methyl ester carboxylesterase